MAGMETGDLDDKCPRKLSSQLREEVAASLVKNGANTNSPCPIADAIFDALYGRLWIQSKVIRSNKLAEQIFELIKMDYDATLDFYTNRRESTLRKTIFLEEDEELRELQAAVDAAEAELSELRKGLESVQQQERLEMDVWLAQYGVERLVHTERISVLQRRQQRIDSRMQQLDEDRDLLSTTADLFEWLSTL
ncbi:Hypothetical predicted protein [Cloeon dipterum]|uniref:Uncharacterized protein n=1 Tax=Cloeon dipterum TaxID=197152 RepID=A0A8S1BW04_9INSE|nr:Hypothetical predicted protein [Cloeon dipterum]